MAERAAWEKIYGETGGTSEPAGQRRWNLNEKIKVWSLISNVDVVVINMYHVDWVQVRYGGARAILRL